ncbi:MAG: hypothetical protein SGPRY_008377 [Prymnesium sp.]
MRGGRQLAVLAAAGALGVSARLLASWWRQKARRTVQVTSTDQTPASEVLAVSFATPWWRRQPGALADLAAARCPLCTQRVSHVTAHFTSAELIDGGITRASKILLYNCCACLSEANRFQRGWRLVQHCRVCTLMTSLALYAANTIPWAAAQLPPPHDTQLRLYAACHLLQARWNTPGALFQMVDVRDQMHYLMSRVLLLFITAARDERHARMVQDVEVLQKELLQMNGISLVCIVWKIAAWLILRQPFAQDYGKLSHTPPFARSTLCPTFCASD